MPRGRHRLLSTGCGWYPSSNGRHSEPGRGWVLRIIGRAFQCGSARHTSRVTGRKRSCAARIYRLIAAYTKYEAIGSVNGLPTIGHGPQLWSAHSSALLSRARHDVPGGAVGLRVIENAGIVSDP